MKEHREYLKEKFQESGIILTEEQTEAFLVYAELLAEWNERMNLSAITAFEDVVIKHFVDSAAMCRIPFLIPQGRLLDIGTGAGFPGLVLKILKPQLQVTLLDSLAKRIRFLEEAVRRLKLENVAVVCGRAEELAHDGSYREMFDTVTARAVAPLRTLAEYSVPFCRVGGRFIAYKGSAAAAELEDAENALSLLGAGNASLAEYELPGSDVGRSLIWTEKLMETPEKYPRRITQITKRPL